VSSGLILSPTSSFLISSFSRERKRIKLNPFYMGACWKMVVVYRGMLEDGGSS